MPVKRQPTSPAKKKKRAPDAYRPQVDESMNVMDVIALHSGAVDILAEYGLHCFQCAFNQMDSIEAGAKSHGLTDTDIENIVVDLQELIDGSPEKPQIITLTKIAAENLAAIAKNEGKSTVMLRVLSDAQGGFCMEFDEKKKSDDYSFESDGVKGVSVIASPATLWRIGGAVIDFREGRFKLDIDEACACGNGGCGCK